MSTWFKAINEDLIYEQRAKLFIFPSDNDSLSKIDMMEMDFTNLKIYRVEYPNIDRRIPSYPITRFDRLVNILYEELVNIISAGSPYYFFGYGNGRDIVYSISLKIISNNILRPSGIMIVDERDEGYSIDDTIKIFLPILRSDYLFEDNYILDEFLNPILGLIKRKGDGLNLKQLIKWKKHNYSEFCYEYLNGKNMVLNDNAKKIMDQIDLFINRYNEII
ncbi:MAG: hypothetical protein Q4P31_05100 [Andreesenia angusta]|nr:hypothetical protein [Andreesenia angusta]